MRRSKLDIHGEVDLILKKKGIPALDERAFAKKVVDRVRKLLKQILPELIHDLVEAAVEETRIEELELRGRSKACRHRNCERYGTLYCITCLDYEPRRRKGEGSRKSRPKRKG